MVEADTSLEALSKAKTLFQGRESLVGPTVETYWPGDDDLKDVREEVEPPETLPERKAKEVTGLSPRENAVLHLILEGRSNNEAGSQLKISRRTIETHRANMMKKLDLHSLSDIFRFGIKHDLVRA